jgi:hypothetical protein
MTGTSSPNEPQNSSAADSSVPHTARIWNYPPGVTGPGGLPKPVYRYCGLARKR